MLLARKRRWTLIGRLQRDAVSIRNPPAKHRGYPRAGRDDAGEVERVAARQPHHLAARRRAPDRPQSLQRLGRRELLANEGAHDAPAAKLAAHLEPAVNAQ